MSDQIGASDALAEARKLPRGVEIANEIMATFENECRGDIGAGVSIVLGRIIGYLALYQKETDPKCDALALARSVARDIAGDIDAQIAWIVNS